MLTSSMARNTTSLLYFGIVYTIVCGIVSCSAVLFAVCCLPRCLLRVLARAAFPDDFDESDMVAKKA